jgi:hypothetical protein
MNEIKLAAAIAMGVFTGLSAWSWTHPLPAPTLSQGASFQQAGYSKDVLLVRLEEVSPSVELDVNVRSAAAAPDACGQSSFSPCYVRVDQ